MKLQFSTFLFATMMLMVSCGYTLEFRRIDDPKKEDPLTVIRRDIRKMKADHRVEIFDLRKQHGNQIASIRMKVGRLGKANESLGQAAIQSKQKSAEIDEQFSDTEIKLRLIHGRLDEEANRFKEAISRNNLFTLKELALFKEAISRNNLFTLKELALFREDLLASTEKNKTLQKQIVLVQEENARLKKSTSSQNKTIQAVSDQVSQMVKKVLPAVNRLGTRLDDLEWQVRQLEDTLDAKATNKRLADLTEAIDVQRQSLEMLGNTLTTQGDKQQALLKKTIQRIKRLEAGKTSEASKGQ